MSEKEKKRDLFFFPYFAPKFKHFLRKQAAAAAAAAALNSRKNKSQEAPPRRRRDIFGSKFNGVF